MQHLNVELTYNPQMSQFEESGGHSRGQVNSLSEQGGDLDGKSKKIINSGWFQILYLAIIVILIWNVYRLSSDQTAAEQFVASAKLIEAKSEKNLEQIQRELKREKDVIGQNELRLQKNLEGNRIKASYIKSMAMEQHYLNKIENMRQLSKTQDIFKQEKIRISYLLGINNFKLIHQNIHIKRQINGLLEKEYKRLSRDHDFSLPEKPFCIVVPTLNNGKDFRYEYNLRSIFNQNYTNYKVVIIDDASTDQNYELIQQYLEENPVSQQVFLVRNKVRMTAVPNIYKAATEYCAPSDILALVDGDDELLGVNVLKVFNSVYTRNGLEVMYSNIIVNDKNKYVKRGWSSAYTDVQKKYNKYRDGDTRMFPLRTFNVSTFLKIRVSDLQDEKGDWFRSAYDQTICPQVLELSCGKNEYIDEYFYLYNYGLGNNDIEVDPNLNYGIMNEIRHRRQRYVCPEK